MPLFNQALQLYVFEGTEAGAFTMPAAAGAANVLGNDLDNTITGNAFDNILAGGVGPTPSPADQATILIRWITPAIALPNLPMEARIACWHRSIFPWSPSRTWRI